MFRFRVSIHEMMKFAYVLLKNVFQIILMDVHRSAGIYEQLSDVNPGVVHR